MSEGDKTARERRAERVRSQQRKDAPKQALKMLLFVAAVLGLLVGGAWALDALNKTKEPCPLDKKHEHATFHMYEGMDRVQFTYSKYDIGGVLRSEFHMHQPNDAQLHVEFGCQTFGKFFQIMGFTLRSDYVKFDPEIFGDKEWRNEGNQTIAFYMFDPDMSGDPTVDGEWKEFPGLPNHQPRDFERFLLVYGDYTDEQLQQLQSQVPPPTDSANPAHPRG